MNKETLWLFFLGIGKVVSTILLLSFAIYIIICTII